MEPGAFVCQEVHSHEYLHSIFTLLWSSSSPIAHLAPRGSFVDQVFRIIMFHQSLLGAYPAKVGCTKCERHLFLDPLHYRYMKVMMRTDSSSYSFIAFKDKLIDNDKLFIESNTFMVQEWLDFYEEQVALKKEDRD